MDIRDMEKIWGLKIIIKSHFKITGITIRQIIVNQILLKLCKGLRSHGVSIRLLHKTIRFSHPQAITNLVLINNPFHQAHFPSHHPHLINMVAQISSSVNQSIPIPTIHPLLSQIRLYIGLKMNKPLLQIPITYPHPNQRRQNMRFHNRRQS